MLPEGSIKTFCLIFLIQAAGVSSQLPDREERLRNERLPGDLWPYHYLLHIQPFIYNASGDFEYDGKVTIYMTCLRATSEVIINMLGFEPDPETVYFTRTVNSSAPEEPVVNRTEYNDTTDFYTLYLESPLAENGTYLLQMAWRNDLNIIGAGMYYTSYDINDETRYLSATQFQPFFARSAFPCFDEPEYKATFDIVLVRKSHYKSLSNMPVIRQEDRGDDWVADIYATTPRMSNYLVCMIVCDFDFVESVSTNGHPTRIWARPNAMEATAFALATAPGVLDFMEDYTNVPYPLPKIDHIAIPALIPAMENWGLITYPESGLLYNTSTVSTAGVENIGRLIAHEVAHQWFGNLVTCSWWDETWLNEGMTSFFNFLPLQTVHDWPANQLHAISSTRSIMVADSDNSSQPVVVPVDTPLEAAAAFSRITYDKGSALMRMFQNAVTAPTFRRALQLYLERHQYGNTQTDDLWAALQTQVDIDGVTNPGGSYLNVTDKFDPWVRQLGYPLLTLSRIDLDLDEDEARVRVRHFLNPPEQELLPSPYGYRWNVPVTAYHQDSLGEESTETIHWIDRISSDVIDLFPIPGLWSILNVNWGGFYRVDYEAADELLILNQLLEDHEAIPEINRAFLIVNKFEIARSRNEDLTDAMDLTIFLHAEVEFLPWQAANIQMEYMICMLSRSNVSEALAQYMWQLSLLVFETEGGGDWTNLLPQMEHTKLRLRELIASVACDFGNYDCEQDAEDAFSRWQSSPANVRIHPDMQLTVWCTAIRTGGDAEWDYLYQAYQAASVAEDADRYEAALACTNNTATLQRYFQYVLDDLVPLSAAIFMVANPVGEQIVWDHLRNNWNTSDLFEFELLILLQELADRFNTVADREQLQAHIGQYPPEDEIAALAYDEAMATVNENIAWMELNQEPLHDWLESATIPPDGDYYNDQAEYSMRTGWHHTISQRYMKMELEKFNNDIMMYKEYYK